MREADLEKWFIGMSDTISKIAGYEIALVEDLPVEKEVGVAYRKTPEAMPRKFSMEGLVYMWFENIGSEHLCASHWCVEGVPFYGMHHEIIEEDLVAHVIGCTTKGHQLDHHGLWSMDIVDGVNCWLPELVVPVPLGLLNNIDSNTPWVDVPREFHEVPMTFADIIRTLHADHPFKP